MHQDNYSFVRDNIMKIRCTTETMFPTLAERCDQKNYIFELDGYDTFKADIVAHRFRFITESKREFERLVKLYGYDTEQKDIA